MNRLYSTFFFEGWGRQLGRNILISGSLYALGDAARQQILKGDRKQQGLVLDKTRRMAIVGSYIGVMDHFWYTALDSLLPSRAFTTVFRKMILDQIIMAPACTSFFFLAMSRMEGKNKAACLKELKTKFWPTYIADWLFWPAAQMLNFLYVPRQYRVPYVAFATFVWTIYLSYMKNKVVIGRATD